MLKTQMLGSSGSFVSREEHEAQMWQIRQEMTQMREEYEEQLSALTKKLQMAAENGGYQVSWKGNDTDERRV